MVKNGNGRQLKHIWVVTSWCVPRLRPTVISRAKVWVERQMSSFLPLPMESSTTSTDNGFSTQSTNWVWLRITKTITTFLLFQLSMQVVVSNQISTNSSVSLYTKRFQQRRRSVSRSGLCWWTKFIKLMIMVSGLWFSQSCAHSEAIFTASIDSLLLHSSWVQCRLVRHR